MVCVIRASNGSTSVGDCSAWWKENSEEPIRSRWPSAIPPRLKPKPLNGNLDRYCAAAITAELKCLAEAGEGQRNEQLNRTAYAVAQFVAAGKVPEDWARGELEGTAVQIGLTVIEARRTIGSAFAAGLQNPRDLPR